jgi:hypothetical protein
MQRRLIRARSCLPGNRLRSRSRKLPEKIPMNEKLQQLLDTSQIQSALEAMRAFLAAPKSPDGRTPIDDDTELDQERVQLIETELKPLLKDYLSEKLSLTEFKTKVDGINKRNELWGFKGIKGQMFFNMVVNVADDLAECDQKIKAAIKVPTNEEIASDHIKTFSTYVNRIGEDHLQTGGTKAERPKPGSVPFFLSYFWQIQERDIWPIFYTSCVNAMNDLNLWLPTEEPAVDYVTYKRIFEELGQVFTKESGKHFGLYDVEHVLWFKGGNPYAGNKPLAQENVQVETPRTPITAPAPEVMNRLPESYVPPIIEVLPRMARNEALLCEAAKASGTSLERAFEKSINAVFTVLGYETKLLGQGKGRVPDGLALSPDDSYAILWDAKVRGDGYNMGTDDRAVKEYITTQSRDLKKRQSLRNIYYLIVSSAFGDDYDDAIRSLKMETDVNEVCLVEADALIAMVEAKMRSPREVSLGPDGLQRLFSVSGVLSADAVRKNLI